MKICIVTNSHHSTDVRLYYKIALSLAKLGQVYLLCASGVRQHSVNPYQIVVDSDSPWAALRQLYNQACHLRPDLVICVEPLTMLVGMHLRRRLGCKVIFDIHEFFADAFAERFSPPFSWLMKLVYLMGERWLSSRADACIGVSDKILDQAVPKSKRRLAIAIPNYPVKHVWDYNCETPLELSLLCETDFDLIYIGGLTRDRGILRLLQAVSLLRKDIPRLNVLILGKFHDPGVEKEFNDTVNDLNLTGVIYYQSWIPAEKIGLLLKRSRVGLWTFNPASRRMKRAVPLKVLEYFAAGLPVVSTKSPLMRDLVETNRIGELCEYNSQSIAAAALKILKLPHDEYEKMQARAIDLIESRFNWEAVEPRLLDLASRLAKR